MLTGRGGGLARGIRSIASGRRRNSPTNTPLCSIYFGVHSTAQHSAPVGTETGPHRLQLAFFLSCPLDTAYMGAYVLLYEVSLTISLFQGEWAASKVFSRHCFFLLFSSLSLALTLLPGPKAGAEA